MLFANELLPNQSKSMLSTYNFFSQITKHVQLPNNPRVKRTCFMCKIHKEVQSAIFINKQFLYRKLNHNWLHETHYSPNASKNLRLYGKILPIPATLMSVIFVDEFFKHLGVQTLLQI